MSDYESKHIFNEMSAQPNGNYDVEYIVPGKLLFEAESLYAIASGLSVYVEIFEQGRKVWECEVGNGFIGGSVSFGGKLKLRGRVVVRIRNASGGSASGSVTLFGVLR